MANKRFGLGMLVLVLVFGMIGGGCDFETEEEKEGKRIQGYSETINGVWYLLDLSDNRIGTIININSSEGTLTAIGNDNLFKNFSDRDLMNIGDTVLKNINFKGKWEGLYGNSNTVYWTCEFIIPYIPISAQYHVPGWHNTYISYNTKDNYIFVYTEGEPNYGSGYRLKK